MRIAYDIPDPEEENRAQSYSDRLDVLPDHWGDCRGTGSYCGSTNYGAFNVASTKHTSCTHQDRRRSLRPTDAHHHVGKI